MKIIWLGHASFRIEIEDKRLLIDPWLKGNPSLSEASCEAAAPVSYTHLTLPTKRIV